VDARDDSSSSRRATQRATSSDPTAASRVTRRDVSGHRTTRPARRVLVAPRSMADFVLTSQEIGRIVQFIAPGFFARVAYEARFPGPERSSLTTIVWSVAASFPLVAVGSQLADWLGIRSNATSWHYVTILLVPAVLAGYAVAALRSLAPIRKGLGRLGLRHQPDGSLYAMTMLGLSPGAVVVLELHDGRMVSGTPRAGPSYAEDDVDEVVLTHPEWKSGSAWSADGAGEAVLIPLREVRSVTFSEDPFT
jgi:hypothetical protein